MDAENAFTRVRRARRRTTLLAWLWHRTGSSGLRVFHAPRGSGGSAEATGAIHEIPLARIVGTVEPSRARLFDSCFRPAGAARPRWVQIWLAEQRGVHLPPISLMRVRDGYAVRDGHHRVSVARARGAPTIDAVVV